MRRLVLRSLIGLGILGCLFVLGKLLWQDTLDSFAKEHERRAALSNAQLLGDAELPAKQEGWSRLIIGAPSGAAPAAPLPQLPALVPQTQATAPGTAAPLAGDFELYVRKGQTLGAIVKQHYGHAPKELVEAVARYNGIQADALRESWKLRLPEEARLLR